jgi:SAM-dependent methyltransferase
VTLAGWLHRAYWAVEQRLVPGLQYSQFEYELALSQAVVSGCSWLDLGCGAGLLPPWRKEEEKALLNRPRLTIGADLSRDGLRRNQSLKALTCSDSSRLPFAPESFDLVTANMVVEHLADPAVHFREIARVLRPGGLFLFHTPNLHSYSTRLAQIVPDAIKRVAVRLLEGRKEEDLFRTFYRANSSERIRDIATNAGFSVSSIQPICTVAIFARFLPLAIPELFIIRALRTERMSKYRPNLIVALSKLG